MGKILILFHSDTQNTAKMAKVIEHGVHEVPGHETRCLSIKEAKADDVLWADGVALGAPVHMGSIPWEMKQFWDVEMQPHWGKIDGKFGCTFASQGGWGGGAEINCMQLGIVLQNYGFLTFGVTDYAGKRFTLHYGATQAGEPRQEWEIESCKRLGRRLAEWVAVYSDQREKEHPLKADRMRFPW